VLADQQQPGGVGLDQLHPADVGGESMPVKQGGNQRRILGGHGF
jgi:hypothetical protein